MKIAISSQNKKSITGHAGKCSRFWLYETENEIILSKELIELKREDILHFRFHESENPHALHPLFEVDLIITGGAGQGFINRLSGKGVTVLPTSETDPDKAIEKYFNGSLNVINPETHHCPDH